jgi:hypothetical protein
MSTLDKKPRIWISPADRQTLARFREVARIRCLEQLAGSYLASERDLSDSEYRRLRYHESGWSTRDYNAKWRYVYEYRTSSVPANVSWTRFSPLPSNSRSQDGDLLSQWKDCDRSQRRCHLNTTVCPSVSSRHKGRDS